MSTYNSSFNRSSQRLRDSHVYQNDNWITQQKNSTYNTESDDLIPGGRNTQIYNYLKAQYIRSGKKKKKQLRIDRVLITLIILVNVFILFNQNQFSQMINSQSLQLHELMTVNYDEDLNQQNIDIPQSISQMVDKSVKSSVEKIQKPNRVISKNEKTDSNNRNKQKYTENPLSFLNTQNTNYNKQLSEKPHRGLYSVQKQIENPTLWQASLDEVEDIIQK